MCLWHMGGSGGSSQRRGLKFITLLKSRGGECPPRPPLNAALVCVIEEIRYINNVELTINFNLHRGPTNHQWNQQETTDRASSKYVCVYVCVCMYVHVHVCLCLCTCTYVRVCVSVCYMCVYMCTCTYVCVSMYICVCVCIL